MRVSVELSMYPLVEQYKSPIIEFVESLRQREGIEIETNGMSSHLYGEYDDIMSVLNGEMKKVFENGPKVVMVMKVVNDDLSGPVKF
ncbi:MAG: hypothetical protein HKN79_10955 [Flavobacteriales bacterium]|nr:hypothetical protein [Flavobacteriales bacterium]